MRNFLVRLLMILVVAPMSHADNIGGNGGVGNGGNDEAQDFVTSAQDGLKFLIAHKDQFPFIDAQNLQNKINLATVDVLKTGQSFTDAVRTAENFPDENKIELDGDRWTKIGDPVHKMALALHEYLGLTNYEVNNYIITSQLFGIANDQMEAPPSIDELDHSFDSYRQSYMDMVNQTRSLAADAVTGPTTALSEPECETFVQNEIVSSVGEAIKLICRPGLITEILLYQQGGVTALNVPYIKILHVLEKRQDAEGNFIEPTTYDYFIGANQRIVEKLGQVTRQSTWTPPENLTMTSVAMLDAEGNAYIHDLTWREIPGRPLYREEANAVRVDGSTGETVRFFVNYQGGYAQPELIFNAANGNDWQSFSVELFDYYMFRGESPWGTTGNDEEPFSISYAYMYLGEPARRPTNMRQITYHEDSKFEVTSRFGIYTSGGRDYYVFPANNAK